MPQPGEDHCNDGKPIKAPTIHLRFPPANFIFLSPQFHRERYCFFVCHGDLLLPQSADWLANHTTQARREPFVLVSRLGDGFPRRITYIFRSSIHFGAATTLSGTPALESLAWAYLDTCGFSPPHLQAPAPPGIPVRQTELPGFLHAWPSIGSRPAIHIKGCGVTQATADRSSHFFTGYSAATNS